MTVQSAVAQGGLVDTIWYYVEGTEQVGPLSLSDLRAVLSRIFDARNILIWRHGFSDWQLAKNVPEFADILIKPPASPLVPPPVPTPASPSLKRGFLFGLGSVLILGVIGGFSDSVNHGNFIGAILGVILMPISVVTI